MCTEGSQVILSKNYCILSLEIIFVLANSVDPNETPHSASLHLGVHCLSKHLFMGIQYKQLNILIFIQKLKNCPFSIWNGADIWPQIDL